jgi:hypothetical protein
MLDARRSPTFRRLHDTDRDDLIRAWPDDVEFLIPVLSHPRSPTRIRPLMTTHRSIVVGRTDRTGSHVYVATDGDIFEASTRRRVERLVELLLDPPRRRSRCSSRN